ncbi:MAG: PAS domain-containing sensor histidine kinase [Ignavibacteria bacterium]|nr:PAS domain-containing sensor histidine kinase [Ignavibacteria bacterium]
MGRKSTYTIVVIYFIFGVLWILITDYFLKTIVPSLGIFAYISSFKGIFFVVLSTLFIFLLLKRFFYKEITEIENTDKKILDKLQLELEDNKRIKEKLLKYQVNLNALIESNLQSFVLLDKDSNIILFNKSAEFYIGKVTGVNIKKDMNLREILPVDMKESFTLNFNKAINNIPARVEKKFNIDGRELWVNFIYNPAFNKANEIFGVIFTGIESTERMNMMNELKKTVEIYEELIKATPDAVSITNKQGKLEYISPVALELLRIDDINKAVDQPCIKWFAEEEYENLQSNIDLIINHKHQTKGSVYKMRRDDGSYFIAEFNSSPIENIDGNPTSFISTFRDITQRIESEEKLRVYSNELKELNASKDRFFSIVAHDLRNPLQGLLGFSSLLNDNFSDLTIDEVKEYIGYIYQSAKKMHSLTNNLLQWSRIKTGKIDYSPLNINVYNAVKHNIDLLKPSAFKKEINIETEIESDINIYADRKMFDSILQNILSNAIKFSYPKNRIDISAEINKNFVRLSIRDYGLGIKKENTSKLFSIDTHFTTTGTQDEEGTGLGLILCKEMVDKHGGEITFESEYKKGSVFSFTLPKGT